MNEWNRLVARKVAGFIRDEWDDETLEITHRSVCFLHIGAEILLKSAYVVIEHVTISRCFDVFIRRVTNLDAIT